MNWNFLASRRGSVLAYTMIFMLAASALVATMLRSGQFFRHSAYRDSWYQRAIHVAESGIDEAAYQLTFNRNAWTGWTTVTKYHHELPETLLRDDDGRPLGYYRVVVEASQDVDLMQIPWDVKSSFKVRCLAGVPDLSAKNSQKRLVQVNMEAINIFSLGLFSDLTLDMSGSPATDSYNSNNGPYGGANVGNKGDIGSNNDILLEGTVDIGGSAAAVGTVDYGENCTITGTIQEISSIYLPPVDEMVAAVKLVNDNALCTFTSKQGVVSSGLTAAGALNNNNGTTTFVGGTPGNPRKYYVSSTSIQGNAKIVVTGPVEIYTDGSIDLTGCAVMNETGKPGDFIVYSSGPSMKLGGTHDFYGAVYAPNATVQVGGTAQLYGAITAGKIDYIGTGDFHYDEALGDVGIIAYFAPLDWQEVFGDHQTL
ncbi:MAG: hypothetical protein HS131_10675 [Ignavibacteriales bacterium]|nr:hypothetical protein [Ignavibacteriales bacterium]